MVENKYERGLLDLMCTLVDGNHANADYVTVVAQRTTEAKLRHLSEWRFYASASSVKISAGGKVPSEALSVSDLELERDNYIREFSNSQNMLEIAFRKLNVSYEKGKEISDIGTSRKQLSQRL